MYNEMRIRFKMAYLETISQIHFCLERISYIPLLFNKFSSSCKLVISTSVPLSSSKFLLQFPFIVGLSKVTIKNRSKSRFKIKQPKDRCSHANEINVPQKKLGNTSQADRQQFKIWSRKTKRFYLVEKSHFILSQKSIQKS